MELVSLGRAYFARGTYRLPSSDFQRGYLSSPNVDVFITFKVVVRASHLWGGDNYSDYQQFLFDTVTDLREKGWYFETIAEWLNENGYSTFRGKRFRGNHVHSIVKKKKVRDERFNREYKPEYSNFQVKFVDRTLVSQV
jgi:hypothetical protein